MIDYAPTFLDIAGVSIPEGMDGISILPLLHNAPVCMVEPAGNHRLFIRHLVSHQSAPVRSDFLVEYYGEGSPESSKPGPCTEPGMSCNYVGPEMTNFPPKWTKGKVCSCQVSLAEGNLWGNSDFAFSRGRTRTTTHTLVCARWSRRPAAATGSTASFTT